MNRYMGQVLLFAAMGLATVQGASITYTGSTSSDPRWGRPIEGNPPTTLASGNGSNTRYDVQAFYVDVTGAYTFLSTATGWDNYTFLYQTSFDAAAPLTNVKIGNNNNTTNRLSGFTYSLNAGVTYFFITTGNANNDAGSFSNTITGPGNITLGDAPAVPEPLTSLLIPVGLLGLGLARRRGNHNKQ